MTTEAWIEKAIGAPDDRPDEWFVESQPWGPHVLRLARPRDPDRLLDDAGVRAASCQDDYMPYWATLWPGARLLAAAVLERPWPPGCRAVEIGCGLGLVGLAALARGLHVTFTDYSPAALALAAHNARLSGFHDFATAAVDWRDPPHERFDAVLGGDVLYEPRCLPDVLRVLERMLAPRGMALLGDPNRRVADGFPDLAAQGGLSVTTHAARTAFGSETPAEGRVFEVRHARATATAP